MTQTPYLRRTPCSVLRNYTACARRCDRPHRNVAADEPSLS